MSFLHETASTYEVVGYEVVWRDGLGQDRRLLCMERERALMFAARYGGVVYPLVRKAAA